MKRASGKYFWMYGKLSIEKRDRERQGAVCWTSETQRDIEKQLCVLRTSSWVGRVLYTQEQGTEQHSVAIHGLM